jgi:fatty-acyl-CoA synthase
MMNARTTAARLGIVAGDRWTSIIPLFHCAGCVMSALGCLQTGATYVGVPSFDPVTMFETIEAERCTVLSGVPTSYLAMLEHPRRRDFDLSSLRTGTCGGADCNPDILQACAREFPIPGLVQVYGQTETATLVACPAHDDPQRFATAGPPLPGHETRIVDAKSGAVLPAGEVGEIQARGPMVMQGYFEMRRETAETLDAEGWLHTGDLGYLTQGGHLVIAGGRLRDMIIRGGENIYPVEIENLLQQHPCVERIAVFGMADTYYGERVAAAVVLGAPATAADLQGFCAGRIARFKVPVEIYVTDAFPLTPSGKVRKVALREQAAAGALRRLE